MLMYSKIIIFYWNADFEASMKQTWNSAFLKVPGDADAAYLQTKQSSTDLHQWIKIL